MLALDFLESDPILVLLFDLSPFPFFSLDPPFEVDSDLSVSFWGMYPVKLQLGQPQPWQHGHKQHSNVLEGAGGGGQGGGQGHGGGHAGGQQQQQKSAIFNDSFQQVFFLLIFLIFLSFSMLKKCS